MLYRHQDGSRDGAKASLSGVFGPPGVAQAVASEVPAWRLNRAAREVMLVEGAPRPVPEAAVMPAGFRVRYLVTCPLTRNGRRVGTLLLAGPGEWAAHRELDHDALDDLCGSLAREVAPRPRPNKEHDTRAGHVGAGYDEVTGLPERRLLEGRLEAVLREAGEGRERVAIALVSLDGLTRIHDWLGRAVADEVLRQTAERLTDLSDGALVGRARDQDLLLVLRQIGGGRMAQALIDRVAQELREPFHVRGYELSVSASFGISHFPDDTSDSNALVRYASIALHRGRERGRGRVQAFTLKMRETVEHRGEVERALRDAMRGGELTLHYQPKVRLCDHRMVGAESLLRWQRGGELRSPAQFIPVAEDSGLIVPIGAWGLREACREMKHWRELGGAMSSVSVNVSASQFARPDFVGTVRRCLAAAELTAEALELEITETSIMSDVDEAANKLRSLRNLGVRVSVDDFGTGYSSLAYLQKLPVDVLKVDRQFIKDLDAEDRGIAQPARALVQAIVGLGHNLGLKVLAEGVETAAQLEVVRDLGCEEVQGFYFSRAVPPDHIPALIGRTMI